MIEKLFYRLSWRKKLQVWYSRQRLGEMTKAKNWSKERCSYNGLICYQLMARNFLHHFMELVSVSFKFNRNTTQLLPTSTLNFIKIKLNGWNDFSGSQKFAQIETSKAFCWICPRRTLVPHECKKKNMNNTHTLMHVIINLSKSSRMSSQPRSCIWDELAPFEI